MRLLCWNSLIGSSTATNKNDSESVLGRSQTLCAAPSDVCGQTLSQRTGDVEEVFSPNMLLGCTLIAVYGPIEVHLQGHVREGTKSWNVRNLCREPAWAGSKIPCSRKRRWGEKGCRSAAKVLTGRPLNAHPFC